MPAETYGGSIASAFLNVVHNIQDIVRFELRLAKTELSEEITKAKSAGSLLGVGAAGLFLAAFFALTSAVFALTRVVPDWAAALIVAVVVGIAGGVIASAGRKRLEEVHPVPERTFQKVKEDIQWAKQQMK